MSMLLSEDDILWNELSEQRINPRTKLTKEGVGVLPSQLDRCFSFTMPFEKIVSFKRGNDKKY